MNSPANNGRFFEGFCMKVPRMLNIKFYEHPGNIPSEIQNAFMSKPSQNLQRACNCLLDIFLMFPECSRNFTRKRTYKGHFMNVHC